MHSAAALVGANGLDPKDPNPPKLVGSSHSIPVHVAHGLPVPPTQASAVSGDEEKLRELQKDSELPPEWPWHEYLPEHHKDSYPLQERIASFADAVNDVFKRLWSV